MTESFGAKSIVSGHLSNKPLLLCPVLVLQPALGTAGKPGGSSAGARGPGVDFDSDEEGGSAEEKPAAQLSSQARRG